MTASIFGIVATAIPFIVHEIYAYVSICSERCALGKGGLRGVLPCLWVGSAGPTEAH